MDAEIEDRKRENGASGAGSAGSDLQSSVTAAVSRARSEGGDEPLVAIAIATHRPPIDLLELAIESIRDQDHPRWVAVISDDASPPDWLAAIRSLIRHDSRFVLSQAPQTAGRDANFERALEAIGEPFDLVALADQTDRWRPDKLSSLIGALDPEAALAYSDVRLLRPDGSPIQPSREVEDPPLTIASLSERSLVPGSGMLFRRELLRIALPFPDELGLRYDQWLALMALATGQVRHTKQTLTDHTAGAAQAFAALHAAAEDSNGRRRLRRRAAAAGETAAREITAVIESRRQTTGLAVPRVAGEQPSARITEVTSAADEASVPATDIAISVQGVSKTYSIQAPPPEGLGERLKDPLRQFRRERFTALEDVSFDVARGEFFGIVGGNGSGKTTLLQILANVYKPDTGRVFIAPRVAPIISLGIGFQADLPALPNVLMTCELLGVSAAEVRRRFDELLAFAGLEKFADLKLRNYSTGMRVRLAFATVMLVDADVLLFDEVLAVGDGAFKQKATQAFENLRNEKTIVLVTHSMQYLLNYCDRAMLLNRGRMEMIGAPDEVARRYAELSLEQWGEGPDAPPSVKVPAVRKPRAEITDVWLSDSSGQRTTSIGYGEEIIVHATIDATGSIRDPGLRLELRRRGAAKIFAPPTLGLSQNGRGVRPGAKLQVETAIENRLAPGPYTILCSVTANPEGTERAVSPALTIDFAVARGTEETLGMVDLKHSVRVSREAAPNGERGPTRKQKR